MTTVCARVIPGDPIPKGRPRAGKGGRIYTPKRTQDAEDAMSWQLLQGRVARLPTNELVTVTLVFKCATQRRCDIDNLAKLVLDAGNKVLWIDDQQVARLVVEVYRGRSDPSTIVRVDLLEEVSR